MDTKHTPILTFRQVMSFWNGMPCVYTLEQTELPVPGYPNGLPGIFKLHVEVKREAILSPTDTIEGNYLVRICSCTAEIREV